LSRHGAILGQTGGGKSWTVASFLQKIAAFPKSTVVLFDLHGEYASAFGDEADVISGADIELPYWLMNSEELLGLMVDRSETAAPNQIAKFKELLQAAKDSHPENQTLGLERITIDTPVYFDFSGLLNEFARLDTEMVPGQTSKPIKGPLHGNFTRLLMRIGSRLNDRRYDLIFHPQTYSTSASMENLFRRLLGETSADRKKVVIIDLSPVPFDVRNSVISLILRCLCDFAYWYRRVNATSYPIAVFADEAHIYLNDSDSDAKSSRESAERIAKEGRKYGISLTVISQRPREVSATILSQCNSFLCLRLSNPDDQSYVKNLLPDSVRGITSMFSTLRRGEGILLGDSVMMPTRIRIDPPNPTPHSEDTSFYATWNEAPEEVDVSGVLDAWRRQAVPDA
jgi:DNA helicase HerA-like ATPase